MGSQKNLPQVLVSCLLVALPGFQESPDLSVLRAGPGSLLTTSFLFLFHCSAFNLLSWTTVLLPFS